MMKLFVIFCVFIEVLSKAQNVAGGNDVCGTPVIDIEVTPLVANGVSFTKGSWPWMSALYLHSRYICGGNLSKSIFFIVMIVIL